MYIAEEPSEFDLRTELRAVEHKWLKFGLKVGFKRATLSKYTSDDDPMSLVLENWCRGNVEGGLCVSWESVVTALKNMDEHGLAEAIAGKRLPRVEQLDVRLCDSYVTHFIVTLCLPRAGGLVFPTKVWF